jgi:hypothetical protein
MIVRFLMMLSDPRRRASSAREATCDAVAQERQRAPPPKPPSTCAPSSITFIRSAVGSFWRQTAREENDTVLRLGFEYVNYESRFVVKNLLMLLMVSEQN